MGFLSVRNCSFVIVWFLVDRSHKCQESAVEIMRRMSGVADSALNPLQLSPLYSICVYRLTDMSELYGFILHGAPACLVLLFCCVSSYFYLLITCFDYSHAFYKSFSVYSDYHNLLSLGLLQIHSSLSSMLGSSMVFD